MPTLHVWFHRPAHQGFALVALVAALLSLTGAQSFGAVGQQAYVKASNTGEGDSFGRAVAISGNLMVVGAPAEDSNATTVDGDSNNNTADDAGAACVLVRSVTNWVQEAYLKVSDSQSFIAFGSAVVIDGNTVVVGAPRAIQGGSFGAAYVFVRNGNTWTQQAFLKASNNGTFDEFGRSVGVSGDTVVVGARLEHSSASGVNGAQGNNSAFDSGAVYVFARTGTAWAQQAYLKAFNNGPGREFAASVSVFGDTVVAGAIGERSNATGVNGDQANSDAQASGAAYVFFRSGLQLPPPP